MYTNLKDISIYVGNGCNFNCTYCDRDFVKSVGSQSFKYKEDLLIFLKTVFSDNVDRIISFHGGEPLMYVNTISTIIRAIKQEIPNVSHKFFIQTNGSLILKNTKFVEEFKDDLYFSISYDFMYQDQNRNGFDIRETLQYLDSVGIDKQLQYVIPSYDKKCFGVDVIKTIVDLFSTYRINSLNLILLRHTRRLTKFETVIEELDLNLLFKGFLQFVQVLYVMGINLAIDGHGETIDKHYYDNHKQLVLAPNGKIYPEYQFVEYKHDEFSIGSWSPVINIDRTHMPSEAKEKIRPDCKNCSNNHLCGLQYYYAMFDIDPPRPDQCKKFYTLMELSINHLYKLKQHNNLLESVGI